MTSIYKLDYDGADEMRRHDECDELERWFVNYRLDKRAAPPYSTEWLTIEEVRFHVGQRVRVRYVGEIGSDYTNYPRRVDFETNAPAPPTFMRPAKERRVDQIDRMQRQRLQHDRAMSMDYLMDAVRKIGVTPSDRLGLGLTATMAAELRLLDERYLADIRQQIAMFGGPTLSPWHFPQGGGVVVNADAPKAPPPPPRHRRN